MMFLLESEIFTLNRKSAKHGSKSKLLLEWLINTMIDSCCCCARPRKDGEKKFIKWWEIVRLTRVVLPITCYGLYVQEFQ